MKKNVWLIIIVILMIVSSIQSKLSKKEAGPLLLEYYVVANDDIVDPHTDGLAVHEQEMILAQEMLEKIEPIFNEATNGLVILTMDYFGHGDAVLNDNEQRSQYDAALLLTDTATGFGQTVSIGVGGISNSINPGLINKFLHEIGHYMALTHECDQCVTNIPELESEMRECASICPGGDKIMGPTGRHFSAPLDLTYSECAIRKLNEYYIPNFPFGAGGVVNSQELLDFCNVYIDGHICNTISCEPKCVDDTFYSGKSFCYNDAGDCAYESVEVGGCVSNSVCGDNTIESDETCDGTDIIETCIGLGFGGGDISCANDCLGYDTSMCTFPSVNVIINNFDGATTDFTNLPSYLNVPNITIEKTTYGKIRFISSISIKRELDVDSNVEISNNRIFVNTVNINEFDKSAILSLYNLDFEEPRILKDGVVCNSCIILSYIGGTLEFFVSDFSEFSAEESNVGDEVIQQTQETAGGGGTSQLHTCYSIINDSCSDRLVSLGTDCDVNEFDTLEGCNAFLSSFPDTDAGRKSSASLIIVILLVSFIIFNKNRKRRK